MTVPLIFPGEPIIPYSVFEDLQMSKLFSRGFLEILAKSSSAGEILLRREFLRNFGDPAANQRLRGLQEKLTELYRLLTLSRAPSSEIGHAFITVAAVRQFAVLLREGFPTLEGMGRRAEEIARFWREWGEALLPALEEELREAEKSVEEMRAFCLMKSGSGWLGERQGGESFQNRLYEAASLLGLEIPRPAVHAVQSDEILSNALIDFFPEQWARIRAFADRRGNELPLREAADYLPQLKFCFELEEIKIWARQGGLHLCEPRISDEKRYYARDAADILLILKNIQEIVPNDVDFSPDSRFTFLSGVNSGGKTTYLRSVGINLLLFRAGCPIFAEYAEIYPFRRLFTLFPPEDRAGLTERFEREKGRVKSLMDTLNSDDFILLNETFGGAEEEKGAGEALKTARELDRIGAFGLFVTHFHSVADRGFPMLQACVDSADGNRRSYKIRKKDGALHSYVEDILKRYGLDRASLARRAGRDGK